MPVWHHQHHQPSQDPAPLELKYPWSFPADTRLIPLFQGKALSCLAGAVGVCPMRTPGVEQGGSCWGVGAASLEFPRGSLRCGRPGWARGQFHTCTAPSSSSSAPTALPPPAGNKAAARLCKTDLPALSSVAELSGLSQPTKPVINSPNDWFSFYPHQSNLGNVYSSIVPHTEAQGK